MSCDEVLERVAAGERPAAGSDIEGHLSVCADCRLRVAAAESLGRQLRDPMLWEEPSSDLAHRVLSAVDGDRPPRRSRLGWWLAAAVAAVAVLVLGVSWLLDRPDWTVDLVASTDVGEASAVVAGWNRGEGTRMVIDVSGLDDAPDGYFYEVWLSDSEGRHVSAGTFLAGGRIGLTAGVSRADYPRIWVTLEPADDDAGPSRATVLDTPPDQA